MPISTIRFVLLTLLAGLATGCGQVSDSNTGNSATAETARNDAERLIGVWEYESVVYGGKPFDVGENAFVEITPEKWSIFRNGKRIDSVWSIDENATPKQLNQTRATSEAEEYSMESVYKLIGDDKLMICEPDHPNKSRPGEFDGGEARGQFLVTLVRRKAQ